MITLLHTADVHLGARFEGFGAAAGECQAAHLRAFDRITDLAEQRADVLIVAGDLFESYRPEPQLAERVAHRFRRLAENGKAVVLIPGTHDSYAYSDCVYKTHNLGGACILAGREFVPPTEWVVRDSRERVIFYGCAGVAPGSSPQEAERIIRSLRRVEGHGHHVALIHGSVMDRRGPMSRAEDMPLSESQLSEFGMDYVALGHHHSWKVFEDGRRAVACYPGSPVAKSFRESGERSVALVRIENGLASVERIAVNELSVVERNLDVSVTRSAEDVAAEIKRLGHEKLLARIHLKGTPNCVLNPEWLLAQATPGFAFLDLVDETEVADTDTLLAWEKELTIRGIFVRKMRERIRNAEGERRRLLEDALKTGALALARNRG